MTNAQIIAVVAAEHKLPIDVELHTFNHWKSLGFSVKKGEHGIECRLWKYNPKKAEEQSSEAKDEEEQKQYKSGFYLAKSYLFTDKQVESIKKETA